MPTALATAFATAYTAAVRYAAERGVVHASDYWAAANALSHALMRPDGFGWSTGTEEFDPYTGQPPRRLFYTATADGRVTEYLHPHRVREPRLPAARGPREHRIAAEHQTLAVPLTREQATAFVNRDGYNAAPPEPPVADVRQLRNYHDAAHGRTDDAGIRQIRESAALRYELPEALRGVVQSIPSGAANVGILSDLLRDNGHDDAADYLLLGPDGPEVAANKPLERHHITHVIGQIATRRG